MSDAAGVAAVSEVSEAVDDILIVGQPLQATEWRKDVEIYERCSLAQNMATAALRYFGELQERRECWDIPAMCRIKSSSQGTEWLFEVSVRMLTTEACFICRCRVSADRGMVTPHDVHLFSEQGVCLGAWACTLLRNNGYSSLTLKKI